MLIQHVVKIVVNVCLDGESRTIDSNEEDADEIETISAPHLSEGYNRNKGVDVGNNGIDLENSHHNGVGGGGPGAGGGGQGEGGGSQGAGGGVRFMEYLRRLNDVVDGFLPAKKDPVVKFYLNLVKVLKPSPSPPAVAVEGGRPVEQTLTPPP